MDLPSSKIDKLLKLLSSSEDEDEELIDKYESYHESDTDVLDISNEKDISEEENLKEFTNEKTRSKSIEELKKSNNDEITVVKLEVEPIVIIDSPAPSECDFKPIFENSDNFSWYASDEDKKPIKKATKVRNKRKTRKKCVNNDDDDIVIKKESNEENNNAKTKKRVPLGKYAPRVCKNRPRVQRNLKCKECGKRMKNEQLFMLHTQTHNNRKETECILCNESFENVEDVLDHYASFDKKKKDPHYITMRPFSCEHCSLRYKNRRDLNDHFDIVHKGQKKYLCPLCGKQFSKRFNMSTHVKLHDKFYFKCERCNKRFRNNREHETHQRIIHGENKLICPICKRDFIRRDNLKAHLQTHDNRCSACNANFNTRKNLNQHMREEHNKVTKYTCSTCGKEFLVRYNYTKHLESHSRVKDQCKICDKEFRNYRDYNAHMRNMHGMIIDLPSNLDYSCPICNKGFSRRDNMKTHMKIHFKWKCNLCDTNFEFRKDLNQHMAEIHNRTKKFTCSICGKVFLIHSELTKHLETHNGIKENCYFCGKEFDNHKDFNAHMKDVHQDVIELPKRISKLNQFAKYISK